jgi:hypothetical protein
MNKSSLLYWFPKIAGLGIPVPRTEIVRLTQGEIQAYRRCEGDTISFPRLNGQVKRVIQDMFPLPVFLRTDEYSGKHGWKKTCFLDNLDNLDRNLAGVIEGSLTVDVLGALPIEAIVVREFIPMDTEFYAFSGEMPVNPERRYFIRNRKVECRHPYWIEDTIAEATPRDKLPRNWKKILESMNTQSESEIKLLAEYAERIAKVLPGYWSVDFCRARDKTWYLIDMAEGDKSWHPKCRYSTQPEKPKLVSLKCIIRKKAE